jgi:hypothetical protein
MTRKAEVRKGASNKKVHHTDRKAKPPSRLIREVNASKVVV